MAKQITVFTTNTCAYCMMVKKFLESKGKTFDVVNLDENPDRQKEILELTGALTVPVTVVADDESGTQQVIVGYDMGKLAPAIA